MTAGQLYAHVLELFDDRPPENSDAACRLADLATCACFFAARGDWARAAEKLRLLAEEDVADHQPRWRLLADAAAERELDREVA
jgi:hypothetical protein